MAEKLVQEYSPDFAGKRVGWCGVKKRPEGVWVDLVATTVSAEGASLSVIDDLPETHSMAQGFESIIATRGLLMGRHLASLERWESGLGDWKDEEGTFTEFAVSDIGQAVDAPFLSQNISSALVIGSKGRVANAPVWCSMGELQDRLKGQLGNLGFSKRYPTVYYGFNCAVLEQAKIHLQHGKTKPIDDIDLESYAPYLFVDPTMARTTARHITATRKILTELDNLKNLDEENQELHEALTALEALPMQFDHIARIVQDETEQERMLALQNMSRQFTDSNLPKAREILEESKTNRYASKYRIEAIAQNLAFISMVYVPEGKTAHRWRVRHAEFALKLLETLHALELKAQAQ